MPDTERFLCNLGRVWGAVWALGLALSTVAGGARGIEPAPGPDTSTNAPAEQVFQRLVAEDDALQSQVKAWRKEADSATTPAVRRATLERQVSERLTALNKQYLEFIRRYPNHARGRLAYGCFLNEKADEPGAQAQWERALELDPTDPDAYNNLAGRYSEIGPSKKAFDFFTKAIQLKPNEAAYYHNFADALYVLRRHAMTNYDLSEQQVFGRALLLYSNAARLQPRNFAFAWDFAQTYYVLEPLPYQAALKAWTNALGTAATAVERGKIRLHLARLKMLAGRLAEARAQLGAITNASIAGMKATLLKAIEQREQKAPAGRAR
jgi:tetratricopeptide (TPR) repeat protein